MPLWLYTFVILDILLFLIAHDGRGIGISFASRLSHYSQLYLSDRVWACLPTITERESVVRRAPIC